MSRQRTLIELKKKKKIVMKKKKKKKKKKFRRATRFHCATQGELGMKSGGEEGGEEWERERGERSGVSPHGRA
jgi:hypothetical protein